MRHIGLLLITLAFTLSLANADLIHHEVKQGETLQKISQQYFGTTRQWIKIWEQNKAQMEWPNSIEVGMTLSFEGPQSTPTRSAKSSPQTAQASPELPLVTPAPAPVAALAVPPPPALVTVKVEPVQVAQKFEVPPPPAEEKKIAPTSAPAQAQAPVPAIHMVEIQPINITRKEPARAIASVGAHASPTSNEPRIYTIRVDTRRALRAIGEDPAALAVDHELPAGMQKVNIGKPAFGNESGVFSSVRVSEDEVHHAAEAQRVAQVEEGIQAEQEALVQPLSRAYEQIVSETTRKAVASANKIQKMEPKVELRAEKKTVASKKEIVAKRTPASETYPAIEPEMTPAKPRVSNEIIQKLGSQNLFGPDL